MRNVDFLSVVVPCHNEEEVLPSTHQALVRVLTQAFSRKLLQRYEVLYVNNGSTDKTAQVLDGLFIQDAHVRVIELRRNFGYQGSISAGLAFAQGDAVVTIDADLQDPPEKIIDMLEFYAQGYDLVARPLSATAAPRRRRQSVNPPVEAPRSIAVRPATSS